MTDDTIATLETKIDNTQQTISTTPKVKATKAWLESLTLTLEAYKAEVETLKAERGTSPELMALQQQVRTMAEEMERMKTAPVSATEVQPKESLSKLEVPVKDAPASLETRTETLSDPKVTPDPMFQARRRNLRWV
jgi:hypothetical protein